MVEHHCQVCGVVSVAHDDPEPYLPPRCCHGCGCGEEQPDYNAEFAAEESRRAVAGGDDPEPPVCDPEAPEATDGE